MADRHGGVVFGVRAPVRERLAPDRELSALIVGDVTAAVVRESERVSVSATQNFVNGVRAFLRFCFVEGMIGIGSLAGGAVGAGTFELVVAEGDQQRGRSRAVVLL